MTIRNAVNNYMMFMWNHWDENTSRKIFGVTKGNHIWNKWVSICHNYGSIGGVAVIWSQLDGECQEILSQYANDYYNSPSMDF